MLLRSWKFSSFRFNLSKTNYIQCFLCRLFLKALVIPNLDLLQFRSSGLGHRRRRTFGMSRNASFFWGKVSRVTPKVRLLKIYIYIYLFSIFQTGRIFVHKLNQSFLEICHLMYWFLILFPRSGTWAIWTWGTPCWCKRWVKICIIGEGGEVQVCLCPRDTHVKFSLRN